jgi:hypothetical protein
MLQLSVLGAYNDTELCGGRKNGVARLVLDSGALPALLRRFQDVSLSSSPSVNEDLLLATATAVLRLQACFPRDPRLSGTDIQVTGTCTGTQSRVTDVEL